MFKKILTLVFVILTCAFQVNSQAQESSQIISWKFKTSGIIYASPVIYNDILYIGSFDSSFYAIDIKTGTEKWHYKTGDKIYTTPIKYNNILCFESGNILYGLNLEGELLWKFTRFEGSCVNQHDEWDYYRSSPTLVDNIAYIGSENGVVYGIDVTSGTKVFQCQAPTAKYTVETSPAVFNNKIYFGDWDGVFYVFDLTTGNKVWEYDTKKDRKFNDWVNAIVTDPVIVNEKVYFGGRSCSMYCMNAETGEKIWSYLDPSGSMWLLGGPTIVDGVLYIGSSYQHVTTALNAETGAKIWITGVEYRVNSKPLVDGDYVIVGTEHDTDSKLGSLCVLNKEKGTLLSKFVLEGQVYSSPIINNDIIYFGCTDHYIYAVYSQKLKNVPMLNLKWPNLLPVNNKDNSASFDTSKYVYNTGNIEDSVTVTTSLSNVTVTPSNFKIAPNDSQKITITVNPAGLEPKTYYSYITFVSQRAIPPATLAGRIKFIVEQTTDVSSDKQKVDSYSLNQNYPNPFNPSTVINFSIPKTSNVQVTIFDALGRKIKTLIDEEKNPGNYSVQFDGAGLASGVYYYLLVTENFIDAKKMVLNK